MGRKITSALARGFSREDFLVILRVVESERVLVLIRYFLEDSVLTDFTSATGKAVLENCSASEESEFGPLSIFCSSVLDTLALLMVHSMKIKLSPFLQLFMYKSL